MENTRTVKLTFKGVVKRFDLPETFKDLNEVIGKLFPETKKGTNTITYLDEEGDLITISSEFDYENCRTLLKKLNINVLKVTVENLAEKEKEFVEETVTTTSRLDTNVNFEEAKELPKDGPKIEDIPQKETFEKVEENIKNLINNGYENIKDFVDSNGGIQNLFNIFKDDVFSLKNNVMHVLKENFGKEEKKEKPKKKQESVEEFKKSLEEDMDKMFKRMKEKFVRKMVKRYAAAVGEKVNEESVHRGITCDGCQVGPIVGVRYKCTQCYDFDFCEKCEAKGEHPKDHIFKKIKEPIRYGCRGRRHWEEKKQESNEAGDLPVHHRVSCDGCGIAPIRGLRFKCKACPNFDFCEKCHNQGSHPKEHSFEKIEKPVGRHEFWKNIRENRCNFFKNFFGGQRCSFPNQEKVEEPKVEEKPKEESGFDFLVKEMKEMYQLGTLDDKLILDALKKANGNMDEALTILFA